MFYINYVNNIAVADLKGILLTKNIQEITDLKIERIEEKAYLKIGHTYFNDDIFTLIERSILMPERLYDLDIEFFCIDDNGHEVLKHLYLSGKIVTKDILQDTNKHLIRPANNIIFELIDSKTVRDYLEKYL